MSENTVPASLAEEPTALVDLVSTVTPGKRDEALSLITTTAQSAGGRVTLGNRALGAWHQLAIAVYPAPAAMLTMLAMPKYRAAHVHREAALARTRLLATRPLGTRNG